jgi:hypothetical protein
MSYICLVNKECKKNDIIECDGCSSRFCFDHFRFHRRELESCLELLCSERDQFHYELTQLSPDLINSLNRIDHWEEQTLAHVKKTTNNARDQIDSF